MASGYRYVIFGNFQKKAGPDNPIIGFANEIEFAHKRYNEEYEDLAEWLKSREYDDKESIQMYIIKDCAKFDAAGNLVECDKDKTYKIPAGELFPQ